MLGLACPYRKEKHFIIHPPLEGWLKRNVPDRKVKDDLFVYFSLDGMSFVVGLWADKRRTAFYDVLCMGGSLENFTWEDAMHFRRLFGAPMTGAQLAEASWDEYMEGQRNLQDQESLKADMLQWGKHEKASVHIRRK